MTHLTQNMTKVLITFMMFFLLTSFVNGEESIATLRGDTALNAEAEPPKMEQVDNSDEKKHRNYTSQPPVIPHSIDNYRIDLNSNKCLTCHARSRVSDSGAPMVSVTHFMDRDGQFKATVSPRRYFCTQCHVEQSKAKPLVANTFVDVDDLLAEEKGMEPEHESDKEGEANSDDKETEEKEDSSK